MTLFDRLIDIAILFGIGWFIYEKFINGNNPLDKIKEGSQKLFSKDREPLGKFRP